MKHLCLALLLCFEAACATLAQSNGFGGLEGRWRGAGQFQGMPSTVEAQFAPLLGARAWALDIDIEARPPAGEPIRFSGRAQYVLRDGALAGGNWIDSQGATYALAPRRENGALIVDWSEGASVRGRSEYRIQPDGDLQIDDFVPGPDGAMRRFATAELRRAP